MQQSFKPNIYKSYETSKLGKENYFLKTLAEKQMFYPLHQAASSISQPARDLEMCII